MELFFKTVRDIDATVVRFISVVNGRICIELGSTDVKKGIVLSIDVLTGTPRSETDVRLMKSPKNEAIA